METPAPAPRRCRRKTVVLSILALFLLPIAARAALYAYQGGPGSWRNADWSSTGTLPQAASEPEARVLIMSGRTGAAFAAKLGTMKVTQEIDALTTMGISPLEFLVLPRVLALVLMMPLLCLYADFVGILGGAFVGVTMLDLAARSYFRETISTLTFTNLLGGLFKATVYGVLIAIAGCLRGFQCGNSSSAVGDATTQAVVTSIVMVVVACGIFAVVFNVLKI